MPALLDETRIPLRAPRRRRGKRSVADSGLWSCAHQDPPQAVNEPAPAGRGSGLVRRVDALFEEDKRVVAAVELPGAEPEKGGALVNRGAFVESTVAALTTAERHERVASQRVELRLLRVNALNLLALWLHAAEGAGRHRRPALPVRYGSASA